MKTIHAAGGLRGTAGLTSVLVLVVVASAVASLTGGMPWWGLSVGAFLAPPLALGLLACAAVALHPGMARRIGSWRGPDPLPGLPAWMAYAAFGVVGFLLIAGLPDRLWFHGDFQLRQGTVAIGDPFARAFPQSLPLDEFLHFHVPRALGTHTHAGINFVARRIGALEAGCLALIAIGFSREVGAGGWTRAAIASALFFGGYLTVFTGLGKTASELCVLTAAIGYLAMRVARGRSGGMWLGILVAAALLLHRSAVLLLPGAAFALAIAARRSGRPIARGARVLLLPLAAIVIMAPRLVSIFREFDLSRHVLTESVRAGGWLDAVAPERLFDLLNLFLVLSPLAISIPFLLAALTPDERRSVELRVLALFAIPWGLALLVIHPQQGLFRDWDVFAPAGVAASLLVGWCLGRVLPRAGVGAAVAVVVVTSTIAIGWLSHFHDTTRGLERIHAYAAAAHDASTSGRSSQEQDREIGKAWEFLGFHHGERGEWGLAADAYSRAVARVPHRYLYVAWGLADLQRHDLDGSRSAFRALTARFPEYPLGWFGLAGVSYQMGDSLGAESALRRLRVTADTESEARDIRVLRTRYPGIWRGDPALLLATPVVAGAR